MRLIKILIIYVITAQIAAADTRLMMVREPGCIWCARWEQEIEPIYPKTEEGRAAPLFKVDLHDKLPEGVTLKRPLVFTPTFILLKDGQETGRLEGYPGEDFFWGLLQHLIAES